MLDVSVVAEMSVPVVLLVETVSVVAVSVVAVSPGEAPGDSAFAQANVRIDAMEGRKTLASLPLAAVENLTPRTTSQ